MHEMEIEHTDISYLCSVSLSVGFVSDYWCDSIGTSSPKNMCVVYNSNEHSAIFSAVLLVSLSDSVNRHINGY